MKADFWQTTFGQNPVELWLIAVGVFIGLYLFLRLLRVSFTRWLGRLSQRWQRPGLKLAQDIVGRTNRLFLGAVALFFASLLLKLPEAAHRGIQIFVLSVFFLQLASWGSFLVGFWFTRLSERKLKEEGDAASATTLNVVTVLAKIVLWVVAGLLIMENLGIHVGSLIAGLGIAGVAVALAVQNILGDLFASLSIVLDKPFMVGDFIIFGDHLGTVERIGLKTTRIRSLFGEQIIVSNADLLRERIRNYKRMRERRAVFTFGVVYDTPPEKVAAIPQMVREIIEALPETRFDRAHFKEFGAYSLNFEVVYWLLKPDYNFYMDTQQAINLALMRRFREEGIEFAFPTQVVHLTPPAKEVSVGIGGNDPRHSGEAPRSLG